MNANHESSNERAHFGRQARVQLEEANLRLGADRLAQQRQHGARRSRAVEPRRSRVESNVGAHVPERLGRAHAGRHVVGGGL